MVGDRKDSRRLAGTSRDGAAIPRPDEGDPRSGEGRGFKDTVQHDAQTLSLAHRRRDHLYWMDTAGLPRF